MGTIGPQRDLPAEPRARGDSHSLKRHGQEASRHLLAGREHHVVLPEIDERAARADLLDQAIGDARHRGNDDGHVVAFLDLGLDPPGDVADAFQVRDGRAAEFHHYSGHA